MAYDKYSMLKALIRADRELSHGDTSHHEDVLVGVVDILSRGHESEEALTDAVFDYLAGCFTRDESNDETEG